MKRRHLMVGAGIAIAAAAVCGTAIASWSGSGSGSGRAQALSAQTVTVDAAVGAADLYPGFAGGDVYFTLTNTNPYPVTFTSMSPGTVVSSSPVACPAANVTVAAKGGLAIPVAAGATTGILSVLDVVSMSAAAPNGCQGVSFAILLTLAGTQA